MTQKLTEEQQRSAHKIIKANRGNCAYKGNYLNCWDCPRNFESPRCEGPLSPAFQAENLRRSQAWLDAHITDAEILAETPQEFCERMVRTGMCNPSGDSCAECAKDYWATHKITPQEPPKRRPKPDEMVVGASVRVRLWNELMKDGKVVGNDIFFQKGVIFFNDIMRKFCGTTHKVIVGGHGCHLDGCGDWTFIPEMLDYVEPEKVVSSDYELSRRDRVDWASRIAKQFNFERDLVTKSIVKGKADNLPPGLHFLNFMDLLPVDAKRIVELENFVKNLTRELNASTRKCDRLQRRLRANWEAKRDGEMATAEEIEAWHRSGKGVVIINRPSKILPNGHTDWIPATRGNLKL